MFVCCVRNSSCNLMGGRFPNENGDRVIVSMLRAVFILEICERIDHSLILIDFRDSTIMLQVYSIVFSIVRILVRI